MEEGSLFGKSPDENCQEFSWERIAEVVTGLDVFLHRAKFVIDFGYLLEPDGLAVEIIENLAAGLSGFRERLAAFKQAS